jgi:hypothetical protein
MSLKKGGAVSEVLTYLTVALGVLVAVVYPLIRGYIAKNFPATGGRWPPWVKKYAMLFLFSLVTALIVLAVYRSSNPTTVLTFWQALVLGFGWEAVIEKIFVKPAFAPPLRAR